MWSGFDTLILVAGILTLGLAALPLASVTPKRRLACVAIGVGAIILSIITGNLDSFTYPQIVYAAPALPVIAAISFFIENSKLPKPSATTSAAPAATSTPAGDLAAASAPTTAAPAQPKPFSLTRHNPFADVPLGDRVRDGVALLLLVIAATRPVYVAPLYFGPATLAQSLAAVSIILGITALALRYAANARVLPSSVAFGTRLWMLRLGLLAPVAILVVLVIIVDLTNLPAGGAVALGPGIAALLAASALIGAPRAAELAEATAEQRARVVTITRRAALGVVWAALASSGIAIVWSAVVAIDTTSGPEPRSVAYPVASILGALFWGFCLAVLARAARAGVPGAGLTLVLIGGATLLVVTGGGVSLAASGYGGAGVSVLAALLCTPALAGELLGRPSAVRSDVLVLGLRVVGGASVVVAAMIALATVVQFTAAATGAVLLIVATAMAIAAFAGAGFAAAGLSGAALSVGQGRITPPAARAIAAAVVVVLAIGGASVSGSGYAASVFFGSSAFFIALTIVLPLALAAFAVVPVERLEALRLRDRPALAGPASGGGDAPVVLAAEHARPAAPTPPAPAAPTPAYTAEQAADPATDAATLHAISIEAPELHPQLAANPASYPDLLDWLAAYGSPEVRAIVQSRRTLDRS